MRHTDQNSVQVTCYWSDRQKHPDPGMQEPKAGSLIVMQTTESTLQKPSRWNLDTNVDEAGKPEAVIQKRGRQYSSKKFCNSWKKSREYGQVHLECQLTMA